MILDGTKTIEVRGSNTKIRETIAIIISGSKKVYGTVDLYDSKKLSLEKYNENRIKIGHSEKIDKLYYKNTHGWYMKNPKRFDEPIEYKHPMGAVIWVDLKDLIK